MLGLEGKGIPRILSSAASMPAFKWISMEEAMPPSSVRLDICHCSSIYGGRTLCDATNLAS
jgi:hypothetical protein